MVVAAGLVRDEHNGPAAAAAAAADGEPAPSPGAPPEGVPAETSMGGRPAAGGGDEAGDCCDSAGLLGRREHKKYLGRPRASRTRVKDSDSYRVVGQRCTTPKNVNNAEEGGGTGGGGTGWGESCTESACADPSTVTTAR